MFLVSDNFWTSLMRKCSMSCHGKLTCSLSASTLPPHFTYIVEGYLFLSECSAPSTPWVQVHSLWPCLGQLRHLQCGRGSVAELYLSFQVGWCCGRAVLCSGGTWDASALYYPTSSVWALEPSAGCADCAPSEVPAGAEQEGAACRQCSLLSSIAR